MNVQLLPVIACASQPSTTQAGYPVTRGPARVLVADDWEPDRALNIRYLGRAWPYTHGVEAECAANGREALDKLSQFRFRLVVLDWNMPGLGGRDVLRAMRADGLLIPVVVVSSQHRKAIAPDLDTLAAAFVNKDELSPISFRNAINIAHLLSGVQWSV